MINRMSEYLDEQLREALGPVNKWYCSQCYGYEVTSPETLLAYYIKHGGAQNFRQQHRAREGGLIQPDTKCG